MWHVDTQRVRGVFATQVDNVEGYRTTDRDQHEVKEE
jgi:hypothetical protein